MAFALPFLSMEMLAMVIPTFSVSSVTLIFRLASITSRLIIIAIFSGCLIEILRLEDSLRMTELGILYTVKSFSDFISTAFCNSRSNKAAAVAVVTVVKISNRPMATPPAMSSPG